LVATTSDKKHNIAVDANEVGVDSPHGTASDFQEMHRVVAKPNRLILYPQDVLHNAFVERGGGQEEEESVPLLPCSVREGRLAISLFFLSSHGGKEIVDVLESGWRGEALDRLRGDSAVGIGSTGMEKEGEEDRRRLMELRRNLVDCSTFVKGETFNEVGGDCLMTNQVDVIDGQQLRIRGASGLDHPVLDRGGSSSTSLVVYRHFLLTGTAKITLVNLKLTGAWVGKIDGGCKSCGYCQKTVSVHGFKKGKAWSFMTMLFNTV